MNKTTISVIISTYNAPKWLAKTLWGYNQQTTKNFELIIADDGSKQETIDLIEQIINEVDYKIKHVWHEDNGFQKSQILNKAILACETDYILMSDGDCIPMPNFVETHINKREDGAFLSGGYHKLPMKLSKLITKEDIEKGNCFDKKWLKEKGMKSSFKNNKINASIAKSKFLNFVTPTTPSWNGHNSSGWKKDIVTVNGFDERMQYGGQDRELGERLVNLGVKPIQIRYNTVCLHLDHPRGYATQESINKNLGIRKETKEQKKSYTEFGINKSKNQ
ncbi:glycosyltransferase family 2 protein [Wenyingzhuangia sp. IMCC45533]